MATRSKTVRAATLAVGTELTDGQVLDRNSAWISQKLVHAGLEVIEHRAVADDTPAIERSLRDLAERVDFLFVTGGLGPTSDDFTRNVLAQQFGLPLEFHQPSWDHIVARLTGRGIAVREIQKQQCYYPRTADILHNPLGTANAFGFKVALPWKKEKSLQVYALPGPPAEIAAVWELGIASRIETLIPIAEREQLFIFRCLGRPESEVAEKTEQALGQSGVRVGYRAHLPYVEVKLWVRHEKKSEQMAIVKKVEMALGDWVTNRDKEDLADQFLDQIRKVRTEGTTTVIYDQVTEGALQDRLLLRIRERKLSRDELKLSLVTDLGADTGLAAVGADQLQILLRVDEATQTWFLEYGRGTKPKTQLEVRAPRHYNVGTERARKYITEMALMLLVQNLSAV